MNSFKQATGLLSGQARKEAEDFITIKTSEDPKTQSISWDVDYTPNLKKLYTDIDNITTKLNKLYKLTKTPESESLLKLGKSLRNRFSRLLTKYPDLKEHHPHLKEELLLLLEQGHSMLFLKRLTKILILKELKIFITIN